MDLVAMAHTVWRHKFATLPIILLTSALGFYALFLSKPQFQASGSYILVNPPAPPTQEQIARDPALANVNANNPLTSYGNLSVVGLLLTQQMASPSVERMLLQEGLNPLSTVSNDTIYGNAPLVAITGVGSTAAEAVRSGRILGQALLTRLNYIQKQMGVSPRYRVTAYPVVIPAQASERVSGKLRNLILVIVVGIILLFVAVSVAKAREERKLERLPLAPDWAAGPLAPDWAAGNGTSGSPGFGVELVPAHGRRSHTSSLGRHDDAATR